MTDKPQVRIVPLAEASGADALVSIRVVPGKPLLFADNLTAPCSECGELIQFRPTAPKVEKKLCMECAKKLAEAEGEEFDQVTTELAMSEAKKRLCAEPDIDVLIGTTNMEIFEEQAKHWPGIEVFRKHAWECVCNDPHCFRKWVQHFASQFPTVKEFKDYLINIEKINSDVDLAEFTQAEWKRQHDEEAEAKTRTLH